MRGRGVARDRNTRKHIFSSATCPRPRRNLYGKIINCTLSQPSAAEGRRTNEAQTASTPWRQKISSSFKRERREAATGGEENERQLGGAGNKRHLGGEGDKSQMRGEEEATAPARFQICQSTYSLLDLNVYIHILIHIYIYTYIFIYTYIHISPIALRATTAPGPGM